VHSDCREGASFVEQIGASIEPAARVSGTNRRQMFL
jgi:hypothetical protein